MHAAHLRVFNLHPCVGVCCFTCTLSLACVALCAQGFWASFMQDVDTLARVHPYVVPPNAHQGCEWLYCGLIGSVLGVCCLNPDGGDYGQWTVLVEQALDKWRGPFGQRGCSLSLQNHR